MKGDRVEIVIDAGDRVREFEIVARRAGRRVETTTGRGVVDVAEVPPGPASRCARPGSWPLGSSLSSSTP